MYNSILYFAIDVVSLKRHTWIKYLCDVFPKKEFLLIWWTGCVTGEPVKRLHDLIIDFLYNLHYNQAQHESKSTNANNNEH